MPVKFYPEKPIELLERYITKEGGSPLKGEIDIYRKLFTDLGNSAREWHVWHDLKLPFHSDTLNPYRKTSAQLDFLILGEGGIMVLEVKGGAISFKNNTFYYGNTYQNKIPQNPFSQAEGYKYTLKDKILNTGSKYMLCHAVALPHCQHDFTAKIIETEVLWTATRSATYQDSIERFILSVFKHNLEKHRKYHRNFRSLTEKNIQEVIRILSPVVTDLNRYYNPNTSEWLQVSNLDVLDSLTANDRIMIEGCPGTGKTTLAKAFIDRQFTKKGLYLCWNSLLMHKIKHELRLRDKLKSCEVKTLSSFLLSLDTDLEYQNLLQLDEDGFYQLLDATFKKLKEKGTLPQYDYLVLDEGQDILDRGADLIIKELLGGQGDGLNLGSALLLYDIDQSYFLEGRDVTEIAELISAYFAHFKLNEVRRSAQAPNIKELAMQAIKSPELLSQRLFQKGQDAPINIQYFDSLEKIKNHIVSNTLKAIKDKNNSFKGSDCVVLIESSLLKAYYGSEPGMHFHLEIKDIEELSSSNIGDSSNKLRFTSILKYKGLEKQHVVLVVRDPSQLNKYELYIGVTRAISNLEILVIST